MLSRLRMRTSHRSSQGVPKRILKLILLVKFLLAQIMFGSGVSTFFFGCLKEIRTFPDG